MSTSIFEELRQILIKRQLGLLDHQAIIRWADEQIVLLDEPPAWLIDFSLGDEPSEIFREYDAVLPSADALTFPIPEDESRSLISELLEAFDSGHITYEKVFEVAASLEYELDEASPLRRTIEIVTAHSGLVDAGEIQQRVVKLLRSCLQES